MKHDIYLEQVAKAYREERLAELISIILREKFGEDSEHADALRVLEQLELTTGNVLLPVMERHQLPLPDPAGTRAMAVEMAAAVDSWPALMEFFRGALPGVLAVFREMEATADPIDLAAMTFLVKHEAALLDLGLAANDAEQEAAITMIQAVIEEGQSMTAT